MAGLYPHRKLNFLYECGNQYFSAEFNAFEYLYVILFLDIVFQEIVFLTYISEKSLMCIKYVKINNFVRPFEILLSII